MPPSLPDLTTSCCGKGQELEGGDGRPVGIGSFHGPDGSPDLTVVQGFHVLGSLCVGTQSSGDAVVCWVVFSKTLCDAPFHDCGEALFDPASGFGFLVPYGSEAGHDVGCGDLIYRFVAKEGMDIGAEGCAPGFCGSAAWFPFGRMKLDHLLGRLAKRWRSPGLWVAAFFHGLFGSQSPAAGFGQGDRWVAPQPPVGVFAVVPDSLCPRSWRVAP